ncbi:NAD(P)/FAD-dependent oxidoreductase [Leifsonia sp. TF02-11]|uniref:NAD(P)/FAD-dependent oxidoreductase n=1 Tax=Leifsonia sp. TF02-11 TaxID=2815212 RepID=UPI001AA0E7C2|nr:FAD-dependent oxidoreductase [Leifsonia sp. TF02-11]MBO1741552.1 FAD-dependent oxidoreductase [Leifsonia sp. TF02-11]
MSVPARIVIVGASVGGVTAAEALRQDGFTGEIVLVGDEPHHPYLRPPLSKQVLLGVWGPEETATHTAGQLDELGVELRVCCVATGLDVAGRTVHTSLGDVRYDEVIIATGSRPRRHPLVPTALTLRTVEDAQALRAGLEAAHRIAVIGAGVLGSEIVSAARKHGTDALMIGRTATLTFGGVGGLLSDRLIQLHRRHGAELALDTVALGTVAMGERTGIVLADGRLEVADVVVSAIGATPRTEWLSSSTLTVADGVVCDSAGRAAPGVSAVGDVAAWEDPFTGKASRVEHQTNAIEQAIAVAARIVKGEYGSQPAPFFWSEVHGTRIRAYGWFDTAHPLVAADEGSSTNDASVLLSHDSAERLRGVVGWDASPREFRTARAAVVPAPAFTTH